MTDTPAKKSDLGMRTISAVVMLAVAGTALWLGGWWWTVFVLLVGFGVMREWTMLANRFAASATARYLWLASGAIYCGLAATMLIILRDGAAGILPILAVLSAVIATDVGAYFAGRAIGGPKIAPAISPSKTWAGLGGGITGASLALGGVLSLAASPGFAAWWSGGSSRSSDTYYLVVHNFGGIAGICAMGALVAVAAQTGDFFESWMKRRAGVKDSGSLIPGHGGLFDRVDGLLAVMFLLGLVFILARMTGNS